MEIWINIFNCEDYQISNYGRIKSLKNKREIILKQQIHTNKFGYKSYTQTLNAPFNKTYTVSRLVAKHFIPNPDNLDVVMHIDDNSLNNNCSNLRWCTTQDNIDDKVNKNRQAVGVKVNTNKLTESDVIRIRSISKTMSGVQIAKEYGVVPTTIYAILTGKTWKCI